MNETSIHKYLITSKCIASFSRYKAGQLFYQVRIEDAFYEFPINTVEDTSRSVSTSRLGDVPSSTVIKSIKLSEDLGETTFPAEIKGSELNRWIKKAFQNGELKLAS